jgi:predicted lactoylglutathione lyase
MNWSRRATSTPILPVADMTRSAAFYNAIGFDVELYEHGGYAFVRGGGITIDLSATDGFNPFTMAGMAYLTVDDVDVSHALILATGLVAHAADLDEQALQALWTSGTSLARISTVENKPWGMREFALADPDNNLLRVGRAI